MFDNGAITFHVDFGQMFRVILGFKLFQFDVEILVNCVNKRLRIIPEIVVGLLSG